MISEWPDMRAESRVIREIKSTIATARKEERDFRQQELEHLLGTKLNPVTEKTSSRLIFPWD